MGGSTVEKMAYGLSPLGGYLLREKRKGKPKAEELAEQTAQKQRNREAELEEQRKRDANMRNELFNVAMARQRGRGRRRGQGSILGTSTAEGESRTMLGV